MAGLPEWRNKPSMFIKWHHVDVENKKPGRHMRKVCYTPHSETARNGSNPENVWGSWKQMMVEMFHTVAIRNAGKQSRKGWSSFPLSNFLNSWHHLGKYNQTERPREKTVAHIDALWMETPFSYKWHSTTVHSGRGFVYSASFSHSQCGLLLSLHGGGK